MRQHSFVSVCMVCTMLFACISCHSTGKQESKLDLISTDSLPCTYINIDTTDINCKTDKEDCPNAKVSYPVFHTQDTALDQYLNSFCLQKILTIDDTSSYPSVPVLIKGFFDEYTQVSKDTEAFPGSNSGWFIEHSVSAYSKIGRFLTIESFNGIYEGGAHPNSYQTYTIIDLFAHQPVKAKDILNLKDSSLLKLGEKYFRLNNSVADTSTLADAGYFIFGDDANFEDGPQYGKFRFNDNIALTKEGVEFLYNTYEIGPYVMGTPSVTIPYKDIQPYLKVKIW